MLKQPDFYAIPKNGIPNSGCGHVENRIKTADKVWARVQKPRIKTAAESRKFREPNW